MMTGTKTTKYPSIKDLKLLNRVITYYHQSYLTQQAGKVKNPVHRTGFSSCFPEGKSEKACLILGRRPQTPIAIHPRAKLTCNSTRHYLAFSRKCLET
jgi:hypothetical protein